MTGLVERAENYFLGRFSAMASPCEVLVDTDDPAEAESALRVARREAERIERKFSRYRTDNVIYRINHGEGRPIPVDPETGLLIDYAAECYRISDGLFDITSGALRRVWTFDGSDRVPDEASVRETLRDVGWDRVAWRDHSIAMPAGMEIDLGGIGKEYAVDRAAALIASEIKSAFLVNFGGDLYASTARRGERSWGVGIDDPDRTGRAAPYRLDFDRGGLATSGDARRFLISNGRRLGHILNPRTGRPVEGAPRSVTVLGQTCLEAGTLSTLAYLKGPGAASFLESHGAQYWIL